MNLQDKTALVTGSSRGIGKAIALKLAEYGADVAINYYEEGGGKNLADAQAVSSQIKAMGRKSAIYSADVSNYESVSKMIADAIKDFGRIDILVNNSAILRDKTLKKMSIDEWKSVIDVNLTGTFNCSRAVIEHMIENGRGRIVNISSISGQVGFFGQTNYSASKSGVIGFTKALAREVASKKITVNAVAPGVVDTDMARQIPENVIQEFIRQIPMGRLAEPEEIAELVSFLVSEKAGYITGQVVHINGGWYM